MSDRIRITNISLIKEKESMKKKALFLIVTVCALLMLGSVAVCAAEDADYEVVCVSDGTVVEDSSRSLSSDPFLSGDKISYVCYYLGVPDDLSVMIYQYGYDGESVIDFYCYYGSTVVAQARVNRYSGAVVSVSKYYTPATFVMDDVHRSDWYYNAAKFVYDNSLMMGTDVRHFSPNVNMTRGMLVTVLYRIEDEPYAYGSSFRDVNYSDWYYNAVVWASREGIVEGYGGGVFGPNDPVTREQMMTILYRYFGFNDGSYTIQGSLLPFSDDYMVSDWAYAPMDWGVTLGLVNGVGGNRLSPQGKATRAQLATIMMRIFQ